MYLNHENFKTKIVTYRTRLYRDSSKNEFEQEKLSWGLSDIKYGEEEGDFWWIVFSEMIWEQHND